MKFAAGVTVSTPIDGDAATTVCALALSSPARMRPIKPQPQMMTPFTICPFSEFGSDGRIRWPET
jgi:hypothetical protein